MNRFENMHPGLDIDHIDNADQRLWHRLERVQMLSGRLLRAEGGRLSRGRDASRGQGRVLKALALVPEISQKDLMVLLDMRQQSLAELLAKLEAKGLVEREQDAEDRRRQVVRLTEAGRAAAAEVPARPRARVRASNAATSSFPPWRASPQEPMTRT